MRNKSLYLLLACVCGTVAAILASQWLKAQANSQGPGSTVEIFVAAVAIDIGAEITPEKIRLEQWPADKVPAGSSGELTSLEGKFAKQRIFAGEAIMLVKLMDDNWTTVPKGYRVVAMKASDANIANLVQPGDRVDVSAYFNKSDLIPRTMTKTVLMGIRVYALDGDMERKAGEDRPKTVRNIHLLIHEKDADAWTYANELGKIRLSLGSDADYSNEDGSNEAGQEFLAWLEEYRKKQEDALKAEQQEQTTRDPRPLVNAQPVPTKKEDGFSMVKLVEGRMMEYWLVPGKLPVLIGEVGGDLPTSDAGSTTSESTTSESFTAPGADDDDAEYSYLNGEDSPFYEPPVGGGSE